MKKSHKKYEESHKSSRILISTARGTKEERETFVTLCNNIEMSQREVLGMIDYDFMIKLIINRKANCVSK